MDSKSEGCLGTVVAAVTGVPLGNSRQNSSKLHEPDDEMLLIFLMTFCFFFLSLGGTRGIGSRLRFLAKYLLDKLTGEVYFCFSLILTY